MANLTADGKTCIEREIEVTEDSICFDDLLANFDIISTCEWIKSNNFETVCLQFPDELLKYSAKIYHEIKSRVDVDLYILGDTSYASCCVDSVAAMHVQGDAIVHYGHSCFSKTNIPVFIVLPKKQIIPEETIIIVQNMFQTDQETKLCLLYDPEFEHCKDSIASEWFKTFPNSYIAYIEKNENPKRYLARIIRNQHKDEFTVDEVKDCVCVYLGSRGQTVFNYTICIAAKDWYILDPVSSTLEKLNETAWFKRRRFLIEKCKDATIVGVLVCQLAGDVTKDIINRMKQLCRANGKKRYIVSVGKPNVAKLANFPEIDIYVMIACPENDLYSNRDFYKPIVYPFELEVALNTNRDQFITTHVTDYNELLPGRKYYLDISLPTQETDVSLVTGRIRETKIIPTDESGKELVEKKKWELENIGQNLQDKSWVGLEQKLGETEVKIAEEGRKGIPLQYRNEPE